MTIRRRDFLAGTLAGAGALLAGRQAQTWAEAFPATHDPYELVSLGKTGIKMTRLGMGTGVSGGNRQCNLTRMSQEDANKVIVECFDQGIRWFDMADLYGTHPIVSNALKQVPRKDLIMATKIWHRRGGLPEPERPNADIVVERFLKELNTDYLDVVSLHCQTSGDWVTQNSDQMKIMDDLKRKGLVRAVGISCHSLDAVKVAANEPWVDSVHARINPYGVQMDDSPANVVPALKALRANGKGVIGMKILGEGRFGKDPDKVNRSIDFAMNLGCVDAVTVGFDKPAQCKDFADRVSRTPKRPWAEAIPSVAKS